MVHGVTNPLRGILLEVARMTRFNNTLYIHRNLLLFIVRHLFLWAKIARFS